MLNSYVSRYLRSLLVLIVVVASHGTARAQEKSQRGVITLGEIKITGRIQKPLASVDVQRLQPKLTLTELKQSFIGRIEDAVYGEPF